MHWINPDGEDSIRFLVGHDGRHDLSPDHADASHRNAVGAWAEKHELGTRLGPNRNERKR